MIDALSIAQALLRCPSVTPADAGALGVLETILKSAGFETHRVTFGEPGTADIDNLYARIGDSADRKSTRLNSSHLVISYAVFCLKKKKPTPHGGSDRQDETSPHLRSSRATRDVRCPRS